MPHIPSKHISQPAKDGGRKVPKTLPAIISSASVRNGPYGFQPSPINATTCTTTPTSLPADFGRMYQNSQARISRSQQGSYPMQPYTFLESPQVHDDRYFSHPFPIQNGNMTSGSLSYLPSPYYPIHEQNTNHFFSTEETHKSNGSNIDPYLSDPLGADYINLKRYMEPSRDPFPQIDSASRALPMLYGLYGEHERFPPSSLPDHQSKQTFSGQLAHDGLQSGYPFDQTYTNPLVSPRIHFPSAEHAPPDTLQSLKSYPCSYHSSRIGALASDRHQERPRPEAVMRVLFSLLRKYYRNGRKNLQCFPRCQAFGDYSMIGIEDMKKHDFMWGKCRGSIQIELSLINTEAYIDDVIVLARIHALGDMLSRFEEAVSRESFSGKCVDPADMEQMKKDWISGERTLAKLGFKAATFDFRPKVWKYLDSDIQGKFKRRHLKYYVQFEAFVLTEENGRRFYLGVGSTASTPFEVGSSRVLARQKRKHANRCEMSGEDPSVPMEYDSMPQIPEQHAMTAHFANLLQNQQVYTEDSHQKNNLSRQPTDTNHTNHLTPCIGSKRKLESMMEVNHTETALTAH